MMIIKKVVLYALLGFCIFTHALPKAGPVTATFKNNASKVLRIVIPLSMVGGALCAPIILDVEPGAVGEVSIDITKHKISDAQVTTNSKELYSIPAYQIVRRIRAKVAKGEETRVSGGRLEIDETGWHIGGD